MATTDSQSGESSESRACEASIIQLSFRHPLLVAAFILLPVFLYQAVVPDLNQSFVRLVTRFLRPSKYLSSASVIGFPRPFSIRGRSAHDQQFLRLAVPAECCLIL